MKKVFATICLMMCIVSMVAPSAKAFAWNDSLPICTQVVAFSDSNEEKVIMPRGPVCGDCGSTDTSAHPNSLAYFWGQATPCDCVPGSKRYHVPWVFGRLWICNECEGYVGADYVSQRGVACKDSLWVEV